MRHLPEPRKETEANVPRTRAIGAAGILAAAALTLSACGAAPATSTTANGKSAAIAARSGTW
ncbi:hypothetical protein GCM10009753_70070 [Streptantibioticus ferralitis]